MSTPLPENRAVFTADEVRRWTSAEIESSASQAVFEGVVTDTRAQVQGKLFVALAGERFDAHSFIPQAAAGGAKGILMDQRASPPVPSDVVVFKVPNPEQALLQLGAAHRARFSGPVVAVAGSAGKTTTRSLTSAVLEGLCPNRVHSTRGNLNNRIGVALSLLALPIDSEVMVLEIGTNTPGEVSNLTWAVRPDLGVLTLIDLEHTEGLIDIDGVEAEEAALFDFLLESGGLAIGNVDDARVARQVGRFPASRAIRYGTSSLADVRITQRSVLPNLTSNFVLEYGARAFRGTTSLLSPVRALAAGAAVAVAESLFPGQLSGEALAAALNERPPAGRGQLLEGASGEVWIDESYNSNPASARACIDLGFELSQALRRQLTLVLGEMRELGRESQGQHQILGQYVAGARPARAVFVGGDAEFAFEAARMKGVPAEFFSTSEAAQRALAGRVGADDLILLKGSRGVRLEALLPREGRPVPLEPISAKPGR